MSCRIREKEECVEVSLSDTGVGIATEGQETLLEEFRLVWTADKKVKGTGAGVDPVSEVCGASCGKIWVKSELGTGSTFSFTLPVLQRK